MHNVYQRYGSLNNGEQTSLPNLMVVGAAKCGTTTLCRILEQHPSVTFSARKEPKYFSSCIGLPEVPTELGFPSVSMKCYNEYEKMYSDVVTSESIVGDGSVDNLYYHENVIPIIKKTLGDPRIVICLRNPVERAYSAYRMNVRDGYENETFLRALSLENQRIEDGWPFIFHYKNAGMYADSVKAYMRNFTNVKVLIDSDLKNRTQDTIASTLNFLGLNASVNLNYNLRANVTKMPRFRYLYDFLYKPGKFSKYRHAIPKPVRRSVEAVTSSILFSNQQPQLNSHSDLQISAFVDDLEELALIVDHRSIKEWLEAGV